MSSTQSNITVDNFVILWEFTIICISLNIIIWFVKRQDWGLCKVKQILLTTTVSNSFHSLFNWFVFKIRNGYIFFICKKKNKCLWPRVTAGGGEVRTVKCKYEYLNISPPAGKLIIYCKKWSVYSSCIVCHDTTNTNLCGRAGYCSLLSAGKIINSHHTDINFLNIHRGIFGK